MPACGKRRPTHSPEAEEGSNRKNELTGAPLKESRRGGGKEGGGGGTTTDRKPQGKKAWSITRSGSGRGGGNMEGLENKYGG